MNPQCPFVATLISVSHWSGSNAKLLEKFGYLISDIFKKYMDTYTSRLIMLNKP